MDAGESVKEGARGGVRREDFIPDRMWVQEIDGEPYRQVDRVGEPGRWQRNVYSDRVIVTQFDDGRTPWPEVGERPTCSASMPSAVAGMLAELAPEPGHHVYEIGTVSGFNAALLGRLVGPGGTVTTVEIDRELAGIARRNLADAAVGNVVVECADGEADLALLSPFDRVIATAGAVATTCGRRLPSGPASPGYVTRVTLISEKAPVTVWR